MKKRFMLAVLILLFALVCPALSVCQAAGGATASPDHITLTWTDNPATTMTVTWRTDATITKGFVEYQKMAVPSDAAKRVKAASFGFTTDIQATRLFTAKLTGLSPNTKYSYRVGDGSRWSGKHAFMTADPKTKSFKFLVFGDSQSPADDYSLWGKIVHNAYNVNPDAKFMVNVGDLVDVGQDGAHWNSWFAAAEGVIDNIPEMPVVGNHETSGSPDTRRPAYWNAQFRLPQNGPVGLKNQVYSYDYGPVHLVVLDSQQSEQKQYGDILTPQVKWLDADLAASKAKWKIVFYHKGSYSVKDGRKNKKVKNAFSPVIEKHHIDLVFNAHDHGVGRTYPIKGDAYMPEPSKGTIYYVAGRSGTKAYDDVHKREWNTFFYNPQDQPNYFVIDVTDTTLTVKTVNMDGTLVDTFVIKKNNNTGRLNRFARPLALWLKSDRRLVAAGAGR
ncbi:MAG: metallophosphoesterase family protein [Chloroflexi bacterium]|nr:metallophosphoesterase family protein [Chloroflexota bacterium]